MGKYDALRGNLPAFQQEPSFQQKIDEAKNQYQALEQAELARIYNLERQKKRLLEAQVSEINVNLEALSQILLEHFEATGLSNFQLQTGETCFQQTEPYSSVQDQAALIAYVKKQKMQNLLTLAWQTMNAMNKERLVSGKPPLPGTAVFLKTSIRLRGGSGTQEQDA